MRGFVHEGGQAIELPFAEAAAKFGQAELVWLHLDGRHLGADAWLMAQDDIPEIARSALLATETRPRSDVIGHGAIVNLRGLGDIQQGDSDPLVSIRIWAEAGRVVSLSLRAPLALDPVISRFLAATILDPGDLLSALASAITDDLDPDVAILGDSLDECELEIDKKSVYRMRRLVSDARNKAIGYKRFVFPQRAALERLAAAKIAWLDDDDRLHLREAADRAARMSEELEAVRERAALVHDELTDKRAEQLDTRSLIISIAAMVFLPLTFITGLFGMNFERIPFAKWTYGFEITAAVCVLIAVVITGWFIANRWLSR